MKIKDVKGLYVAETEKKFRILVVAEDVIHARKLAREYFEEAGHEPADFADFKVKELSYYADPNLICFDCDYVICEGKPAQEKARPTLTETIFTILQDPYDFEFNLYWVNDFEGTVGTVTDFFTVNPNAAISSIKKSEFFKCHIPFFTINIKEIAVSFDTVANARVVKCNGIEENGKKRYDIYITNEIPDFKLSQAVTDCLPKYYGTDNNIKINVDTGCELLEVQPIKGSLVTTKTMYYAKLDKLGAGRAANITIMARAPRKINTAFLADCGICLSSVVALEP